VVDVRPHELQGLCWSFLTFFFLLGGYYVLRPLRDEMGIAAGVDRLQWLFTATLAAMLLAVPIWSALVARFPAHQLIPWAYRFFLVNLLLFFVAFRFPDLRLGAARVFFVWTSVFNLLVVSVFWSLMADVFRREQGNRLFGFVSAGGSAGAIAGPLVTSSLVGHIGPINLLLIAALLLEAAAQCAGRVAGSSRSVTTAPEEPEQRDLRDDDSQAAPSVPPPDRAVGGGAWSAIRLLVSSPYLGAIAIYVVCLTASGTFGYVLQARLIAARALDPTARTALFARIDLIVNVGSAVAQALVAGRVLTGLGVVAGLVLPPVLTIASALALGAFPHLGVLIAGLATRRIAEYSIARPAREVLFTVVTREEKYKPTAVIDTVVYRAGDAASSWTFALIARQGASIPVLSLALVPLALAWLAVALWIGRLHERRAGVTGSSAPRMTTGRTA
jgi:AAA family ATP:ADP antiporter